MMFFFAALVLAAGSWIHVPGSNWSPGVEVVAQAQAKLKPYVTAQAAASGRKLRPWSTYTFQYQGQDWAFKLRDHVLAKRRVIFVNAFCTPIPPYAASEFVSVSDGGTCYFQAYYDTVQHKFMHVLFNGVG